jgi:hypothetical protein
MRAVLMLCIAGCSGWGGTFLGECVFWREVEGRVLDTRGDPVAGVRVSFDGPVDPHHSKDASVTTTDDAGAFALDVPEEPPRPFDCALAELTLAKLGCETRRVRPSLRTPRAPIVLTCD